MAGTLCIDSASKKELKDIISSYDLPSFRADQLYSWLYRTCVLSYDEMSNIPLSLRDDLAKKHPYTEFHEVRRVTSKDGSIKFLFSLSDGAHIESVLLRDGEKVAACISSQVGCRMGCAFCATYNNLGYKRNLTCGEILAQVRHLRKVTRDLFDIRLSNLVFMGMGEALDNFEEFVKACDILLDADGFDFSHRKITVSTSGLIPQIEKLFELDLAINLAVSINASRQECRRDIMPISNKYPLESLVACLANLALDKRQRITLEYVLLGGVNDSLEDAKALAKIAKRIKSKINLIIYNEHPFSTFHSPKDSAVERFQEYLISQNISTFLRKRLGKDIAGACGQLAGVEDNKKL